MAHRTAPFAMLPSHTAELSHDPLEPSDRDARIRVRKQGEDHRLELGRGKPGEHSFVGVLSAQRVEGLIITTDAFVRQLSFIARMCAASRSTAFLWPSTATMRILPPPSLSIESGCFGDIIDNSPSSPALSRRPSS